MSSFLAFGSNPVLAFDIDGTLFDCQPHVDYESPVSVVRGTSPRVDCAAILRHLVSAGARVAYVTGRCHHLRGLTWNQLQRGGFPIGRLITNQTWLGYDAMADYKAVALGNLQASLYVGDHEADRKAARLAGIPFIHEAEFRQGAGWRLLEV